MKRKTKQTCVNNNCHPIRPQATLSKLKRWFQDPNKPIQSCNLKSCKDCSLSTQLDCHFNMQELVVFYLIIMPVFTLGTYIIFKFNWLILIAWFIYMIAFFGFIEIRVMCSHCPHYGQKGTSTLKCWANYGAPKLWKYRPGPMNWIEKTIFILGFIILFSFPIIPAILLKSYLLLGIYLILLVVWKWLLKKNYCRHCNNFACPFNKTDRKLKNQFLNQNPSIKKAWKKTTLK